MRPTVQRGFQRRPRWPLVSIERSLDHVVEHPVSTGGFPRSKCRSSVDRNSLNPKYHFRWYSLNLSSAALCLEDVVRSLRRETKSILRWEFVLGKGLRTTILIVARSSNHLDSPRINYVPKTVSLSLSLLLPVTRDLRSWISRRELLWEDRVVVSTIDWISHRWFLILRFSLIHCVIERSLLWRSTILRRDHEHDDDHEWADGFSLRIINGEKSFVEVNIDNVIAYLREWLFPLRLFRCVSRICAVWIEEYDSFSLEDNKALSLETRRQLFHSYWPAISSSACSCLNSSASSVRNWSVISSIS